MSTAYLLGEMDLVLVGGFLCAFLVACTQLYKPLCLSVGRSVSRSVGPSVGRCSRSTRLMAIGLVDFRTRILRLGVEILQKN